MEKLQVSKESFANYRYFESRNAGETTGTAQPENFVTYLTIFQSDFYCINDLNCYYNYCHVFSPNFTGQFSINLTRKGYFTFETYKRLEEEYASRIMLEKPGCEFRFIQREPGEGSCTVISFTDDGYEEIKERYNLKQCLFFRDANVFSTLLAATGEADFIHHAILTQLQEKNKSRLQIDCLVADLVEIIMQALGSNHDACTLPLNAKRYHLRTIERAKEYLLENFSRDVSLKELARHCFVSQFHFTRLFRQFCGYSPFGYLHQVRLKHAETLIKNTDLPVTDICFRSGFNRLDYFSWAFAKQYGASPTKYKIKTGAHKETIQQYCSV